MAKEQGEQTTSTRHRLILAALRLFSKFGYDATSTRMIAQEAGVNLSAISFHFSGKESLHTACLEFVAERTREYYQDVSDKIAQLLSADTVTLDEVYACLTEIVAMQINAAFGRQYRTSVKLIYWEQINSLEGYHPVTSILFEKIERSMAELIAKVTGMPYEKAYIASRYLNGSIISFGEHSRLVQYALGNEDNLDQELHPWIRKEIADYCDTIIRKVLSLDKDTSVS